MSKWSVMIYNERRKDIEEVSGHKKFFYLKHGWTTGLEEQGMYDIVDSSKHALGFVFLFGCIWT